MKIDDFFKTNTKKIFGIRDFNRYGSFDENFDDGRPIFYSDYISAMSGEVSKPTDNQIKRLEKTAEENIKKGLKPYTRDKYGELREITANNNNELIRIFVSQELRNPSPVIVWHYPGMVKLATPHIASRIKQIRNYEKTKADLYQAIEDLEQSHKVFLEESEQTIESVLERGHNFIL